MHARGIPPGRNVASRKVVSHCPGGVRIGGDHRHLRCAEARERSVESAASPRRIHGKHYAAFRRGSGTLAASRRRDEREMARARRVRGRILHPRDELVGADAGRQVDGPPAHPLRPTGRCLTATLPFGTPRRRPTRLSFLGSEDSTPVRTPTSSTSRLRYSTTGRLTTATPTARNTSPRRFRSTSTATDSKTQLIPTRSRRAPTPTARTRNGTTRCAQTYLRQWRAAALGQRASCPLGMAALGQRASCPLMVTVSCPGAPK